jgi:uncharacterized protein YciI
MPYFFCRLTPPRTSFPLDITAREAALMEEHGEYWRIRAEDGVAIAFGPVLEGTGAWGLGVAEAENETAMRAFTNADPIIRAGIGFRFDIHPMPSLILRQAQAGAARQA